MKRVSIRKQLLVLLVPFLFSLWIASATLSFWLVSTFCGEAFDRDLINSADSIVGRLRVKDGKISVDLPPAAQAILKHDESDKVYYRVLGSNGNWIYGDTNLPKPAGNLQVDVPNVHNTTISGTEVRLVDQLVKVDEADGEHVIVQLGQTTNVRNRFQQKMLLCIAVPQFLVITIGLLATWYGIAKTLAPLRLLQNQVLNRSHSDLSPIGNDGTPEEVYPLVAAINHLLERLREDLQMHKRFIANAAHQLRTPLAGLKTYSSMGCEITDKKELPKIVRELDQGIDRATRVVTQLLALARTDGGDSASIKTKTDIDLNFLVCDVVEELVEQSVRKNLELRYEPAADAAIVFGEQTGLRHLVSNLIENAVIYTPGGGNVIVRVAGSDDGVHLSVSDTGPGIPQEEREKVFERFYRVVGAQGNGSGLGLSIVKEVANAHNARLSIEAASSNGGAIVHVEFPRQ